MGNNHIIAIEQPAKLNTKNGCLCINTSNGEVTVSYSDIAVIILANPQISISQSILSSCAENGAVVVCCSDKFMPNNIFFPYGINAQGSNRPLLQSKCANTPAADMWWQTIIKSKIYGQALTLKSLKNEQYQTLKNMAESVMPKDNTNIEGAAAKIYWNEYFKHLNINTSREKQGTKEITNQLLNYSYSIVRSATARAITGFGLHPAFGVGHYRKDNPYNLVEDFTEPFRYLADKTVLKITENKPQEFTPKHKQYIINTIIGETIEIDGKKYRFFEGIARSVESFTQSLARNEIRLSLPNLPLGRGRKKQESEIIVLNI